MDLKRFLLAAAVVLTVPAMAQVNKNQLKAVETNHFINANLPKAAATEATPHQETFGERMIREYKERGRALPASEEKILRLKPGTRNYVRQSAEGEKPLTFTGFLQYSRLENGLTAIEYGYYKFSSKNGFVRENYGNADFCLNGRGIKLGDTLYGTSSIPIPYTGSKPWQLLEWDTDTWEHGSLYGKRIGNDMIFKSVAQDPTTQKVYGWNGGSTGTFSEVDYPTASRKIIQTSDSVIVAMDFTNDGQLYGVTENGAFCKIDKTNGKCTYIRMLDFEFMQAFESMTCDRRTNKLYLVASEIDWDIEDFVGRLCEIDPETGTSTLIGYLPEAEEYTCLAVLEEPEDKAPAALNDLFITQPSEANTGMGVMYFTIPTKNVAGEAYTLPTHYEIYVNSVLTYEGDAQPGDFVSKVLQNLKDGRLKVVVVLTGNDNGELYKGERNVFASWVGQDTPRPSNVTLTYDDATKTASVKWNGSIGLHGGRVDASNLTYNVFRMPDSVKVAQNITEQTFSETLQNAKFNGYFYEVVACIGEEPVGEVGTSNTVQFGSAYEVPYTEDFEKIFESSNQYIYIDGNNDGVNWEQLMTASFGGKLHHSYSKTDKHDDWALTPPIRLVEGVAYKINFKANSVSPAWPETFSVACGMGTDPSTYEEILPATELRNNIQSPKEFEGEIKVKATGDYHFAFHAMSPKLRNAIMIDDIQITAGQLLATPDASQNVKLVAAGEGELEVTIDFDAPRVCNDGSEIVNLNRIEIYRGEKKELIYTIAPAEPGKHYQYVDRDAVNGELLYTIVAFNEAGAGLEATSTVYVGYDAPNAPKNVVIGDNLDGTAKLSWDAPTTGQHNGYVDPDELQYNVFRNVDGSVLNIAKNVNKQEYTVTNIPQTGDQGIFLYGVSAINDLGESEVTSSLPIVYGAPYTIPYEEGFALSGLNGIWSVRSNASGVSFRQYSGISADGDNTIVGVESDKPGAVAQMTSGKISLAGSVTPRLTFAVFGDPGTNNTLKVAVAGNGAAIADTLATVNFKEVKEEAFRYYSLDLSEYKTTKYVTVSFIAELNDTKYPMILLDDVSVRNVNQYDVAATATAQSRTTAGEKATVNVTVHNVGEKVSEGYAVKVYLNNHIVGSVEKGKAVSPLARETYSFEYTVLPTEPENSNVWAVVEYDKDLEESDNTTAKQALHIVPSQLEAVSGLVAAPSKETIDLTWNTLTGYCTITEGFEGYESFSAKFGRWTTVDRDKCATAGINGLYWPGTNQPQSFITFNFRDAGVTEPLMKQNPQFEANSGTQFLACFKANDAPGNRNNDWLISPELSGKAQMVSIYAESLASITADCFEVLYSTATNDLADFKTEQVIGQYSATKNDFSRTRVNLPEGAKYFAIHCNSSNGGILMLDDITYEAKQPVLVGYNIYCDGALVGTAKADATTFSHSTSVLTEGQHTYYVTAVYEEGESALSNPASAYCDGSGIEGITADETDRKAYTVSGVRATESTRGIIVEKGKATLRK